MPERIVVAHDDLEFRETVTAALKAAGYGVRAFAGSMDAIVALDAAERIQLLITCVNFPQGTPNGVALARMARLKKPGVYVLFAAREESRQHTEGLGEFLPIPVRSEDIVATVERMLEARA